MHGIDEHSQNYLRQWDASATIRKRSRYRPTAAAFPCDLFPVSLLPIAKHQAVAALGKDAVHELLVRAAYHFQSDIASIEVEVVTDLCNALAFRKFHFDLPDSARQVALTIAADEIYHAYTAREFIADVKQFSGIESAPTDGLGTSICNALSLVRKTTPPEFLGEAETMALCFAENFVTDELFDKWKGIDEGNPFRAAVREHLIDEGRHQKFFQTLLRHMWSGIDDTARDALGRLLPGFLDVFLMDARLQREKSVVLLASLGFDRARSLEIVTESYAGHGAVESRKHAWRHVSQCLNLIRMSGILDHAPTRESLIESGWVAP